MKCKCATNISGIFISNKEDAFSSLPGGGGTSDNNCGFSRQEKVKYSCVLL